MSFGFERKWNYIQYRAPSKANNPDGVDLAREKECFFFIILHSGWRQRRRGAVERWLTQMSQNKTPVMSLNV